MDEDDPQPATDPAPRRRPTRRAVIGWTVGCGAALLLVVAVVVGHHVASTAFDDARSRLAAVAADFEPARENLEAALFDAVASAAAVDAILVVAADDLVDVGARSALESVSAAGDGTVDAAAQLLEEVEAPVDPPKPAWTWELVAALSEIDAATRAATDTEATMRGLTADLDTAGASVKDAAGSFYASIGPASAALEVSNISARGNVVLNFRAARDAAAQQTEVRRSASLAFEEYARKAEALKQSAASELAEKAGPLYDTRLEIESFARSLSGGVVLDFDWQPLVNDLGGPDAISGTSTYSPDGGHSTITLSNSVAEWWPGADARALVVHEVGHSISSKCYAMFDWQSAPANEAWATAWALSLGYTAEGNGTQAYGYPPQELIETAAQCR